MVSRQTVILVLFSLLFTLALTASAQQKTKMQAKLTAAEAKAIAQEAYIYGLQQVVFYGMRYGYTQLESSPQYVGINRLWWLRQPITPEFRQIVTPNATTLYGSGFFDLSKEPLVVELPAIQDRYYSFQAMDQYGDYFFYAGNQFTGTKAQKYLLSRRAGKGRSRTSSRALRSFRHPPMQAS